VFIKKIEFCSQIFDFNDDHKNVAEKNERLKYISELSDLLLNQSQVNQLIIPNLERVMTMI
jgi:serine/threonine-protein phosphatase 2A regulatory subunit B'